MDTVKIFVLHCPLRSSLPIWPIHFICGTHTTHCKTMCHAPFPGEKVKIIQDIQSFCHVRSEALSLFHRSTSYVVHKQSITRRCVMHHFQINRSKVKFTQALQSFWCVRYVAPSLFDSFTYHLVHTQPMKKRGVMHHFGVKRSKSHGSFEVYAMSAPWLHPYFTDLLHMWHTHNPWRYDVSRTISRSKGQSHMGHSKFLLLFDHISKMAFR